MENSYPLENVEIQKIYRSDKNQEGKPYLTKKGQAFEKVDIYVDPRLVSDPEFKGKATYFDFYGNTKAWDIGSSITGKIIKSRQYFNLELPSSGGSKSVELDLKELVNRVDFLERKVKEMYPIVCPEKRTELSFEKPKVEAPAFEGEDDEESDDLPF